MTVGESNLRGRRRFALVVIAAAVFMANLDLWIVNVAFVDIARDLGGSLSAVSWVLNAYAVTLAALLVPAGRLGDRLGHRRVFLGGVALFTVASVLCAAAPDLGSLVAVRVLQAAGAAAQLPTSLALLMASVAAERRTNATRGWAAVGAVAAVCGPVLGGLLVAASWRWVFLVNQPIGLLALAAGVRTLPRPPAREREPLPDLLGAALLTVAVAAITGALVQAPDWGWTAPGTVALAVAAVLGAVLFVERCRTHERPVLELPLLRVPRFRTATVALIAFSAAFAIMLLSNSLWCQEVWGWSALRTGLALGPGPLMVPLTTVASARLLHRYGAGRLTAAGGVLFTAGFVWRIATAGAGTGYAVDLLPAMLVGGIGVGLAMGTLIAAGATALPPERAATGSGLINSARQVASALGVAVLVTVLARGGDPLAHFRLAWTIAAGLAVLSAGLGLRIPSAAPVVTAVPVRPVAVDDEAGTVVATG
ncbi:MAG: MFS transporter [Jatrophihabitans sp.]|uniref:MFS transporter n=1 Tax=Jatrophihabitans sp. TaxID=1932789 RepID=UPI003F7F8E08